MHLFWHHRLDEGYIAEKSIQCPYLHTGGVIPAVSPWVLHPAVPPHLSESSCSNFPMCALSCMGRAGTLQSDFQDCQHMFDCCYFLYNVSELCFFFKFPLWFDKSLGRYCLLFKPVDWSFFLFMCKSLSLADTLMRVLVVSFIYSHFYLYILANHGLCDLP